MHTQQLPPLLALQEKAQPYEHQSSTMSAEVNMQSTNVAMLLPDGEGEVKNTTREGGASKDFGFQTPYRFQHEFLTSTLSKNYQPHECCIQNINLIITFQPIAYLFGDDHDILVSTHATGN